MSGGISEERLFLALVNNDAFSSLPEMLEILGQQKFMEFVEIFGGLTITIPNMETLRQSLRDLTIHERNVTDGVSVSILAEEYDLTPRSVRRIIANVDRAYNFGARGTEDAKNV